MFETAELGRKVTKQEYDRAVPRLRADLLRVQNELRVDPRFSVVIIVNGVDGAGKGETVNLLHEWMDPRYLAAHAFGPPSDEEAERPEMWRFWRVLPPKGRIGIIFGSWYTRPILRRAYKKTTAAELAAELVHINTFEKLLVDDGTLLLKFWFHLGKKVQKKRLKSLSRDPKERWRVTREDWQHFEMYDDFVGVCERALRETSTGEAPWTIIEGADARYRELTVGRHILEAVTAHLGRPKPAKIVAPRNARAQKPSILSKLDLAKKVSEKRYKLELPELQGKLNLLSRELQERKISALVVFEGSDAAGKGGALRRITGALDARYYKVVPIAAPNDEERARHYLWRFWRHLPRAGFMTLFDRSWYGRVLVERVEGFASEAEWRRAYLEINEFEELLAEHGTVLVKFWLHIDKDEQLRRFKERAKTSFKQYKITDEDYRNREKWDLYELAVNDMVERTSTSHAPWTLVGANDKYAARIQVLETCCASISRALKAARKREK